MPEPKNQSHYLKSHLNNAALIAIFVVLELCFRDSYFIFNVCNDCIFNREFIIQRPPISTDHFRVVLLSYCHHIQM